MNKRNIRIIQYTISMYLFSHIIALTLLPIGIVIMIIDRSKVSWFKRWFSSMIFWIVGKEIKVRGLEHVDREQNYVIVSNYPSFYAGFALMNIFPDASIVAHGFIEKLPILGYALKQAGAIFVDGKKMKRTKVAMDNAIRGKEYRQDVMIFPEGQRTPDGGIKRFRRGFVYILRESKLSLMPVTLNGYFKMKPVNRLYFDPDTEIEMLVHKPIISDEITTMSDKEILKLAERAVREGYRP